jgi:hypothetical protein
VSLHHLMEKDADEPHEREDRPGGSWWDKRLARELENQNEDCDAQCESGEDQGYRRNLSEGSLRCNERDAPENDGGEGSESRAGMQEPCASSWRT